MPRQRLGVALLVPEPYSAEIDGLRRALGDGALGRIPAHLTLVPPVNVTDGGMAFEVVRRAAAATPAFRLRLGPPGTFWPDRPVVYLGVEGEARQVLELHRRVMQPPLERSLAWPYVPHVTVLDEAQPAGIEEILRSIASYRVEVSFDRVHLLREGPGRVWEPIGEARFGPARVVGRGGLALELVLSESADAQAAAWAKGAWWRFDRDTYGPSWSPDRAFAVAARREGEVVGLAEGSLRGDVAGLSGLVVGSAERGQGVGSALLAAVESLAAEAGCTSCRLTTPAGGPAEGFFGHRGWARGMLLAGWRHGLDFVVMERRLG